MCQVRTAWHPGRMMSSGGPVLAGPEQPTHRDPAGQDPAVREPAVREPADGELAGRLRMAVGLLVRRLRQRDPGDLSVAQLSALVTIESLGPVRSGDLAAREHVAAPTMTRLVGMLADAGYVTRSPDPSDGRGSLVSLAPAGAAALDAVRRQRTSELSVRLARLSPAQRASIAAALPALEALLRD
ncbi:MAG: hypothetical protein AVDCRST_MAG41-1409 [uncultured Corynebacteriales bacterium]|uniref:HTH marR-type domain-containing protein n=1 Tax=uncultured Mycobacteriales bacterium TaxID=581187 RepID=A0A6J4I3K4_9ACTN|nr:MAG: hypothetical protein AVDCRST_MAG41-1409 [uncultured Corynebacteriales bacterium]